MRREKQRASKKRQSATKAQALEQKGAADESAIDVSDGKLCTVGVRVTNTNTMENKPYRMP